VLVDFFITDFGRPPKDDGVVGFAGELNSTIESYGLHEHVGSWLLSEPSILFR
jgi:hypothetical protein